MTRTLIFLLLALPLPHARAQLTPASGPAVRYALAFPNAAHHEAQVTATFAGLPSGPLHVRMARSSPGRYAQHDFAKNVYAVTATDGGHQPLPLRQPDPYGWDVTPAADGTVIFSYTLYGDRSDGTYAGIDAEHAHLNLPATLCYATGLEGRPAELRFALPAGWQVASQLQPSPDKAVFSAPNLQYLMDSPVTLGPQQVRTWPEGRQTIELAALYPGPAADVDAYVQKIRRVVQEEKAIFGELPAFDFGRYTFVADYLPQAISDGMEHRNSTSVTSPRPLGPTDGTRNLGTVAHEFFHSWNVERLRPHDLEPFDFQRVNMSDALWFAEGFTQYFGCLALRRAGLIADEEFLADIGRWVNLRQNSPGARRASALEMSRHAAFTDAATSIDPTNTANTYLSYYDQGAGLALVLDLELRQAHHSSLDQFMQAMWRQYGQQVNYAPVTPYTVRDLQRVLGTVSGDTAFANQFFRQYVYGHELPRFRESLLGAGLALVPAPGPGPALARQVGFDEGGRCLVIDNTRIGSGLYQAGLDRGDQLVALDGQALKSPTDLLAVLRQHPPGAVLTVQVKTPGGTERTTSLPLDGEPIVQAKPVETVDKKAYSPKQKTLREAWLKSQAPK
ncbi:MAG: M61 family metallopeptidase [Hymenobacter sp.]